MNSLKKRIFFFTICCLSIAGCGSSYGQNRKIPDEFLVQGRPNLKYPDFRSGVLPEPSYIEEVKK